MADPTSDTLSTPQPAAASAPAPAREPAPVPAYDPPLHPAVQTGAQPTPRPAGPPLPPPVMQVPTQPSAQPYQWPAPQHLVTAPPPAIAGPPSNTYRGLTIASFVLSVIAVIGVVLLGLGLLSAPALQNLAADPVGKSGMVPLTGSVSVAAGRSLPAKDLANAVEQRILDDGAADVSMTCPSTAKVAQGVVTVCHGDIEGDEWAVVVYFEDELGEFTLGLI